MAEAEIKEEHYADIEEEKARKRLRWPKVGCLMMVAGMVVPPIIYAVEPENGEYGALLQLVYWVFSALFFVGILFFFFGWLSAKRFARKEEPARSQEYRISEGAEFKEKEE